MNRSFEEKLQTLSQQTFNSQLNELDEDVLKRLRESRRKAIASIKPQGKRIEISFPSWLSTASTATAFASVALITASLWLGDDFTHQSTPTAMDDVALLSSTDDLEFYENLDFYIWLEDENNAS